VNRIDEAFRGRPNGRWRRVQVGGGRIAVTEEGLRLAVAGARRSRYANAQLDDYLDLARAEFPWRPPLRLTVRARFSGPIRGTAGFGFWNSPLSPLGSVAPVPPAAIWFFYAAPPADMPLALGVPGHGWKAATIDSRRPAALAWAPLAPAVLLLNNIAPVERRLWPLVQRSLSVAEAPLDPPGPEWRTYTLEWRRDDARFTVDGETLLETDRAPLGPLGFVAWVDSQWLVATPRGRFGWGLHDVPGAQWMDLARVAIEPLEP
jgi:hypothetical protein